MRVSLVNAAWPWVRPRHMLIMSAFGLAFLLWKPAVPAVGAAEPSLLMSPPSSALRKALPTAPFSMPGSAWVEQIRNSLDIYQANNPTYDFYPYRNKLAHVRQALNRGDRRAVTAEMEAYFKLLDKRVNGISSVTADALFSFAQAVTPIQEYKISVSRSRIAPSGMETPRQESLR